MTKRQSILPLLLLLGSFATQVRSQPPAAPAEGNRLAREQSPYLREHARDPVDWHPWSKEAFDLARKEGKPVFLSIGYSACHWCHVMQRESFQNAEIASILKRFCIAIKVDREERPDVDRVYIEACRAMSPSGCGWPLTAFLTPERKPFFVGTYFPPTTQNGRRGFKELCLEIETAWRERRAEIEADAATKTMSLAEGSTTPASSEIPDASVMAAATAALEAAEDRKNGGFGGAPKFPYPNGAKLLLRRAARADDAASALVVKRLLGALRRGGIHDHLEGGFHRYATDAAWRVPHFEKMLYDQAQIALLFLEGHLIWKDGDDRRALESVLEFVQKSMTTEDGGFCAALDADTEHVEGKTYTWTLSELKELLLPEELETLKSWSALTEAGNFEAGQNTLFEARSLAEIAKDEGKDEKLLRGHLKSAFSKLRAVRSLRLQPRRDDKVLTSWNGLMISAYARAGAALNEPRWVNMAVRAADLIFARLRTKDGLFLRSLAGGVARHQGELSDHSAMMLAALDLAAATRDQKWMELAKSVGETIRSRFVREGVLVDSIADDLIFTTRETFDGAWPSGVSMAALAFVRLGIADEAPSTTAFGRSIIASVNETVRKNPAGSTYLLLALDLIINPAARVELTGDPEADAFLKMEEVLRSSFLPFLEVSYRVKKGEPGRAIVCVGSTCLEPADNHSEMLERIRTALERH